MIRAEGVSKGYRSGRGRVAALTRVSCSIGAGGALAVVGKSGSGKTTLMNCVGGLEKPEEGRVLCDGVDLHSLSRRELSLFQRRNVGFVFQFGNLLSYLTVAENIGFPLALNGVGGRARRRRVQELLERILLPGIGRARPRELSGGEVQRVSFARAVAHRPRLLLADEPTASLDSDAAGTLVRLMREVVREQGCTLMVCTHDPVVVGMGDEIVHLRDGRIVEETEFKNL